VRKFSRSAAVIGSIFAISGMATAYATSETGKNQESASTTSTLPGSSGEQLARNPVRIKHLSSVALSNFESSIQKSNRAEIWVYAGVCAIIGTNYPNLPKGQVAAEIVPDPGIIHTLDPKSGYTFSESITWDGQTKQTVLGLESILRPKGPDFDVGNMANQINIFFGNASLRTADVEFLKSQNMFIDSGTNLEVMTSAAVVEGNSLSAIADNKNVKGLCAQGISLPPVSVPATQVA